MALGQAIGGGEFGSVLDLLALVDDKAKYEAKIKELDSRIASAKQAFEQAAAQNSSAENHRAIAGQLVAEADKRLAEANATRTAHAADVAKFIERVKAQDTREQAHAAAVGAFEANRAKSEADLQARHSAADERARAIAEADTQADAARKEIIAATNLHLEKAKANLIETEHQAAMLAVKRKRFLDFVAEVKAWDRD